MTIPTGTFTSFAAVGNREDLSDAIYNISPTDTPFMSMIAGKSKAKATLHEWQTDSLAATGANALVEGDDAPAPSNTATSRLVNYTQISGKTAIVTGTQEAVDKAGRKSELAYQFMKKSEELKRDMEAILTGNQVRVVGNSTTARQLRSLEAWYTTNDNRGTGGADGSASAAATDATTGDLRAFTEDLLLAVLKSTAEAGGKPDYLMLGTFNKRVASGFSGGASATIDATGKKRVNVVDIYVSDFGTLKIVYNLFQRGRTAHVLQSDMWNVAYLRNFKSYTPAVTGDHEKKAVVVEYTLEARNEASSGVIADLTTS